MVLGIARHCLLVVLLLNLYLVATEALKPLKPEEESTMVIENDDSTVTLTMDAENKAIINLHGATVTSWVSEGVERLYLRYFSCLMSLKSSNY